MRLLWSDEAWEDYVYRQRNGQKALQSINDLIGDIRRNAFKGLGKPEPLKHSLSGWWSRRITREHRLVYRVSGRNAEFLEIIQCRHHP
jgi:toxin YoeB